MNITKRHFGKLKDGRDVYKYTLINNNDIRISILNYGGIITDIITSDKNGMKENIILSFDNIQDYEERSPHFGCITGRVAGRISNAEFNIDNDNYKLFKNDLNACIHGGELGLSKRIWSVSEHKEDHEVSIELGYFSPHMEDLFPGDVEFKVKYSLNNDDELKIEYFGKPDRKTIINLTNHSYFNLLGAGRKTVLNHRLKVNSDYYIPVDKALIPLGTVETVRNSPFNFNNEKELTEIVNSKNNQVNTVGGLDHAFVLKGLSNAPNIQVHSKESGRFLEVKTDQPAVVIYASCQLPNDLTLANGENTKQFGGLCLETQDFPDSINQKNFPSQFYDEDHHYYGKTVFRFGVKR